MSTAIELRRGGALCALTAAACLLVCTPAPAAPLWAEPKHPVRAVFARPDAEQNPFLLQVPLAEVGFAPAQWVLYGPWGHAWPCRELARNAESLFLLATPAERSPDGAQLTLYLSAEKPAAPPAGGSDCPQPLAVSAQDLKGKGVPDTWEKMLHLLDQRGRRARSLAVASPDQVQLTEPHLKDALVRLSTFLLCPADGSYRFSVAAPNPAFLFVDGSPAATSSASSADSRGTKPAPALVLRRGVVELEAFTTAQDGRVPLRLEWQPPGAPALAPVDARSLVAASEAAPIRIEKTGRTLQPAFTATIGRPYSFHERTGQLVPVNFRDATENWLNVPWDARWDFGDGASATGSAPTHVYAAPGRYTVRMTARDGLGFETSCSRPLDCRNLNPRLYFVAAGVGSLPAAVYPDDILEPALQVDGSWPEEAPIELLWTVRRRGAPPEDGRAAAPQGGGRFPIVRAAAGALERIDWSARHAGIPIERGSIDFLLPPYDRMPAAVAADRLLDGAGRRLVYVASGAGPSFGYKTLGRARSVTLVHDGLLDETAADEPGLTLGRLIQGAMEPRKVELVRLTTGDEEDGAYRPLLRLVQAPAAAGGGERLAVLWIGLQDIIDAADVGTFERQAAALTDMLISADTLVLWVTPPPLPPEPEKVRPFASAIYRLAEARGLPVADVFTPLSGAAASGTRVFAGASWRLTEEGRRIAAQTLARTLSRCEGRPVPHGL